MMANDFFLRFIFSVPRNMRFMAVGGCNTLVLLALTIGMVRDKAFFRRSCVLGFHARAISLFLFSHSLFAQAHPISVTFDLNMIQYENLAQKRGTHTPDN